MVEDLRNLETSDERNKYVSENPDSYDINKELTEVQKIVETNDICKSKPIWPDDDQIVLNEENVKKFIIEIRSIYAL